MIKKLLILFMLCSISWGTITNTDTDNIYTGDNSDVTFDFNFDIFATSEVGVYLVTTATGVPVKQTETTHYSVSATNNNYRTGPGGTVTMVTAPTTAQKLYIVHEPPLTQTFNLDAQSTFRTVSTKSTEDTLDKLATQIQWLQKQLDTCVKIPVNEAGLTTQLPNSIDRASEYVLVDASGNLTTGAGTSDATAHSTIGAAVASASSEFVARAAINAAPIYDNRDYANLAAAITAIGSTAGELHIWDAETLTDNATFPSTLAVVIHKGGSITKASTYTCTFNGPFDAGIYQVFSGFDAGDVKFSGELKTIYPQWWQTNTVPGTTDMQLAFNSALQSMWKRLDETTTNIYGYDLTVPRGLYYCSEELRVKVSTRIHGEKGGTGSFYIGSKLTFPQDVNGIVVEWGGGSGTAEDPTTYGIGTIIEGLHLNATAGGTTGCGIVLGATASVRDCGITYFAKHGIYIQSTIGAGAEPNEIFDQLGSELVNDLGGANNHGGSNDCTVMDTVVLQCGGDGVHMVGGNTNGCRLHRVTTQLNGGVGFHIQGHINGLFTDLLSEGDVAGSVRTWPDIARYTFIGCSLADEGSGAESYAGQGTLFIGGDPGGTLHADSLPSRWIGTASGGNVASPMRFTSRLKSPGAETIDFRTSDYGYNGYMWWGEVGTTPTVSAIGMRPVTDSNYTEYRLGEIAAYNPIQFYWSSHPTHPGKVNFPDGLLVGGSAFASTVTAIKTIDVNSADTTDDYQLDNTAANMTEQVVTISNMLPAYAELVSCQLRCTETVTGTNTMSIDVGTTSGGNEIHSTANTDAANDINTSAVTVSPELAATNAARSVYVNFTPGVNWDTPLVQGRWAIMISYIDYGAIYTNY